METEKILSISIAAYNVERYLGETLASLAKSALVDLLDVLIINDGSTDGTAEIAEEYVVKYPDSFRLLNKENGGYGSTINCALKHARGRYIKLLDGDDWFNTDQLTSLLQFLHGTSADIIFTQHQEFDGDSQHPKAIYTKPYTPYDLFEIKDVRHIRMQTLTVKTALVKEYVTITENCFYTDDEWYIKSLLCCKTCVYLPICVYCYRKGREGQSVSTEGYIRHIDELIYISKQIVQLLKENECLSGLERSVAITVRQAYYTLLICKRTPENLRKLFAFRRYIRDEAAYTLAYMERPINIMHRFPFLMLIPYSLVEALWRTASRIKYKIKH